MSRSSVITVGLICGALSVSGLVARAGVIGYWRFEGDATGFVTDSSSNGLTLTNGDGSTSSTYPTQYPLPASGDGQYFNNPIPRNGLANSKAASFDGGDWFSHGDESEFAVSDFTIEAYIHRDRTNVREVIASQYGSTGNQRSWAMMVFEDNELHFFLSENGTSINNIESGIVITSGVDYFVAASFDESVNSTGVKFYVKNLSTGVWLTSTSGHAINSLHNSTASFNIGMYGNSARLWDGLIDEVRWSDEVLPYGELLAAVPEPGTLVLLGSGAVLLIVSTSRRRRRR